MLETFLILLSLVRCDDRRLSFFSLCLQCPFRIYHNSIILVTTHHAAYHAQRTMTYFTKGKMTQVRIIDYNTATRLTYWLKVKISSSVLNLCRTNASGPSETTATDLLSDRRCGLCVIGTLATLWHKNASHNYKTHQRSKCARQMKGRKV